MNDISSTQVKNCEPLADKTLGDRTSDTNGLDTFAEAAERNAKTKDRLKAERAKDNEITMKAYGIK